MTLAIGWGCCMSSLQSKLQAEEADDRPAWNFATLCDRVEKLAAEPYRPSPLLPQNLQALDYDRYRLIAFEHARSIWKPEELPFWLEMFHRGYLYQDKVQINLVHNGQVQPLKYNRDMFQYRGETADLVVPEDIGFAGFRIIGKFAGSEHPLEIASLLGASYFRAIAPGQVYGSSARGLAVDVGLPKPEEFPVIREYWIEQPSKEASKKEATSLKLWALLDSPSVAGAYEFLLTPGKTTTWDVKAHLVFRKLPEKVALAPITSMWMWGDGVPAPANERRPEVHDSDGLLIHTEDDRWIWRPLTRLNYPSLSHYDLREVRGFGLLQRDRDPEHYRDDEARYVDRPSVWIEPQHSWQNGAVELLELPADHEGIDNIATWWTAKNLADSHTPLDLAYRVSFMSGGPKRDLAKATATRVKRDGKTIRVEVDFAGQTLAQAALASHANSDANISPEVNAQRGQVRHVRCKQRSSSTWTLSFDVEPAGQEPVELDGVLKSEPGEILSEQWRYLCPTQLP